jgi:N-acetylglucosaminyl-diphospho-decaprenol L-rhamnosyltransferase
MADVRVGIVSWNTAELLDRCLAALPAALGGLDAEVVVVDNDSADDSADVAARRGVTVIRNETNVGYARAMNQALSGSDAPVLLALNPDTEPTAGSLAALVDDLHAHPDAGLVVPRLVGSNGDRQHSVYRFPTIAVALVVSFVPGRWQRGWIGRRWWLEAATPHDASGPIDWAIGAVHVIRSTALAGDPPYSERWFMYVEDLELCWRLHRRGWAVRLDADVAVPHVGNASGEQRWGSTRARRYWTNTYDFDARAHGRVHARLFAAANVTGVSWTIFRYRLVAAALGSRGEARRHAARDLRTLLPVHARAVVSGPPEPDSGAP